MKICNFCTVIVIIITIRYFSFKFSFKFHGKLLKRIFNEIKYLIEINGWCWSNQCELKCERGKWHRFWFHFRKVCDEMSEIFNGETFSTTFRDTDFHPNQNFQIPTMLHAIKFYVFTKHTGLIIALYINSKFHKFYSYF